MKGLLYILPTVSIFFQNKNGKNLMMTRALLIISLPVEILKVIANFYGVLVMHQTHSYVLHAL